MQSVATAPVTFSNSAMKPISSPVSRIFWVML
jgi:hypothetical protein